MAIIPWHKNVQRKNQLTYVAKGMGAKWTAVLDKAIAEFNKQMSKIGMKLALTKVEKGKGPHIILKIRRGNDLHGTAALRTMMLNRKQYVDQVTIKLEKALIEYGPQGFLSVAPMTMQTTRAPKQRSSRILYPFKSYTPFFAPLPEVMKVLLWLCKREPHVIMARCTKNSVWPSHIHHLALLSAYLTVYSWLPYRTSLGKMCSYEQLQHL